MDRQRKRGLRDLNARVWSGEKDVFSATANLDSSLKKNTAFIKRLRTSITASSEAGFLQDIRSLSLHKYLSELISACYEGLAKVKKDDVPAAVEIFSALHQRFGPNEFTRYVAWLIGRGLSSPDKSQLKSLAPDAREREEKERTARHRSLLRVVTELWLVNGLRSLDDATPPEEATKGKENARSAPMSQHKSTPSNARLPSNSNEEPFPLEALKDLLGQDSQHANLTLAVTFVKTFAWDLLGKRLADDTETPTNDPPLADEAMQQRFRNVLTRYYESACSHLIRDQENLNIQSRRNQEAYVRSGEIFEDRQANFDRQVKGHERFVASMQTLSDALNIPLPDLREKDAGLQAGEKSIGLVNTGEYLRGDGEGPGIWEDDDERRFYENLVDLKERVPGILLEEPKKKKPEQDEAVGRKMDDKAKDTPGKAEEAPAEDAADQSTAIANKTVGAQVDALLASLPELTTKESVDQMAIDFCFLNSKASRNRLLKAVQEVPKGRSDLFPLYARLVTTLGRNMSDIGLGLVTHLDEEFRSLQRRKQKDTLGSVRTGNVRYLAELTKFGLVPEHVIFHCFKVGLDDFSKMNIEIICNLMENCGRYLLRNPETSPRMKTFLETLQRKKSASHLGQQERMLIENAVYYVNPPDRSAISQKERTPMDLFVRKLLYHDLSKRTLEKVAKQIRKLHWEEIEVVQILRKLFTKPGKIKYSSIHFLAIILGALNRYHPDFSVSVIDDVLENITVGLESNDFKLNQRRIAEVKYLGELYVYRMVDSSVIFDTMFRIVTFGHGGWPRPDSFNPLDVPSDFFRIRLICILLETCGSYYEKGAARRKLDFFLNFFQYYVFTKEPAPMEIEFALHDAFEYVRPSWKLASSLEEAGNAFAEACKEQYKASGKPAEPEDQEIEDLEDDGELDGMDGRHTPLPGDDESSDDDEEVADDAAGEEQPATPEAESDEEEQIIVTRPQDERDLEAEAEFDRELAKLMSEGTQDRKVDRRPMFDIPLPMRRAHNAHASDDSDKDTSPPTTVKFSLLSKKGNRPQTRDIDLPADSNFAVAMKSQQEAENAEKQRIKKLVLNYDLRDDDTDGLEKSGQMVQNHVSGGVFPHGSLASRGDERRSMRRQQQPRKLQIDDVDW